MVFLQETAALMPCIRDDGTLVPLARDVLASLERPQDAEALFQLLKQPLFMIRKALRELTEAGYIQAEGKGYVSTLVGKKKLEEPASR